MKLSEVAKRVIDLAGKVYDYYTAELPKFYKNYPLVNPGETDPPPPAEKKELEQFLRTLPEDTIYQLQLLANLGSGMVFLDEMTAAYEELKSSPANWEWAVSELLDRATLAGDLSDGLDELKQHDINVDKLPLKRSRSRK